MAAIALLVVGLASAGYSAYSAREGKKEQKQALQKELSFQKTRGEKAREKLLSQQRSAFLASGISIFGTDDTPSVFFEDTKTASAEDLARMDDYYATNLRSVDTQARAQYIGALGQAVSSYSNYSKGA